MTLRVCEHGGKHTGEKSPNSDAVGFNFPEADLN
jgi:hypothetical protein